MGKKVLLLMMLGFSVAMGGFWALHAQDPQNPSDVRRDPPTVSATTTQTDLSGTYTGTFNCEPLGLMGETTLTITGNDFTTADGRTGRIVASTTGGYTAVVLQMGATETGATGAAGTPAIAPIIVSMRGRKSGNRLILTPVSGTAMRCSFTPGRGTARGRRNPRTQPPSATGTEVANPAVSPTESPSPIESPSPMPEQTPSPMPSPTVSPTPSPEPEPMPSPSPGESPVPTPVPSPGEPMPTPSPGSSPSPSPTPSPSPRW